MGAQWPVLAGLLGLGGAWAAPEGHLVNRDTGPPFSIVADPCGVRRVTVGADPAAYRQALRAVKALVGTEAWPSP